jgi:FkbM family methyltransferase
LTVGEDTRRTTAPATGLYEDLLARVLRDAHAYAPGVEQRRATRIERSEPLARRAAALGREHARDLAERAGRRAGFARRHFDPRLAAARLARLAELAPGLEATSALLGDERSREALLDVLTLRVLGPFHAPLRVTPGAYRSMQARADRELRLRAATFEVSDPWFSPLSLYRVPAAQGPPVVLHSHSVDVVSVFLLHQYAYEHGAHRVGVQPGDVVLDVGGCWGDTALLFARLVGPAGKVFTFEFDPENLRILRANLALNPELAPRIEVVEQALWDGSAATLGIVQAGRMSQVAPEDGPLPQLEVPAITLDEFAERAALERLDFVKMDVEGAELRVLAGARRSLERFAPRLAIAAYHRDDDLVTIPSAIAALGRGYRLFLDSFSPVEEETVLFAAA